MKYAVIIITDGRKTCIEIYLYWMKKIMFIVYTLHEFIYK